MARREGDHERRPHSWAAFAAQDVEDAERGRPAVDLRAYAQERGLAYDGSARCLHVLGVLPRWTDYVFNACRGTLGGARHGVVFHELLELRVTSREHGSSLAMGGAFARTKLRGRRITLRSFIPVVGMFDSGKDEPFPELSAAAPVTTVAVHVPDAALLPEFTVRSADRLPSSGNPRLSEYGLLGYRLRGDALSADQRAALFGGAARGVLAALDGPYVDVRFRQASLALRVGGFAADAPGLDALVDRALALADALGGVARETTGAGTAPARFGDPLPPPPAGGPDVDGWDATLDQAAAAKGLVREDPDALHRAYPTLPVPGRARGVLRGPLAGGAGGRVSFHQHRAGSFRLQAAALFPAAPGGADTPPGGVLHEETGMWVGRAGDLVAAWPAVTHHRELAITGTAEQGLRAARALGLAA